MVPSDNDNDDIKEKNESNFSFKDNTLELLEKTLGNDEIGVAIRIAIQQIPYIGGSISEILSYQGQRIEKKRLRQCLEKFGEEIRLIDESKIDKEFVETEEFIDILRMALENSIRTRHIERMRLFCKILAGALNKDNIPDRDYAEDFQYFVANLTPTNIMVGIEIYKLQKHRPDHFGEGTPYKSEMDFVEKSGVDKFQDICKLDDVPYNIAIHKLATAGLIKQAGLGLVGDISRSFIITPMFQKLMNFVQLSANDPLFNLMIRKPED